MDNRKNGESLRAAFPTSLSSPDQLSKLDGTLFFVTDY